MKSLPASGASVSPDQNERPNDVQDSGGARRTYLDRPAMIALRNLAASYDCHHHERQSDEGKQNSSRFKQVKDLMHEFLVLLKIRIVINSNKLVDTELRSKRRSIVAVAHRGYRRKPFLSKVFLLLMRVLSVLKLPSQSGKIYCG